MFKTMISKAEEGFLPILGGIGGGISGGFSDWIEVYQNAIWSALIFAVVGGVAGFIMNKLLQWIWKGICRVWDLCKKKK